MTTRDGRAHMDCSNPLEPPTLMDYWLADLPSSTEEAVEEHLLSCDRCGDRLREVIALADGLSALARSGSLRVVVTDEFVQRATGAGRRVREYAPPLGGSVQCTVEADDDLLVARLAADLSGAARVDLSLCDGEGVERQRMTDVPVGGEANSVIYQESITFAKASPSNTMIARLLAVDAQGAERLLGEYTFHHTRTIPGPGGWES
jgi:anti-sigma factor RsiW